MNTKLFENKFKRHHEYNDANNEVINVGDIIIVTGTDNNDNELGIGEIAVIESFGYTNGGSTQTIKLKDSKCVKYITEVVKATNKDIKDYKFTKLRTLLNDYEVTEIMEVVEYRNSLK
jgi:hypothetical protein